MAGRKKTKNVVQQGQEPSAPVLPSDITELFVRAVDERASMQAGSALATLIGRVFEAALDEELTEHLGYPASQRTQSDAESNSSEESQQASSGSKRRANTRNGYTAKKLKTAVGATEIEVPRDRVGSFEPKILPKNRTTAEHLDDRVVAMYASGMTCSEIAEHVRELYGFAASEMFVSRLVERLDPELTAWRNRPLEEHYAVLFVDAVHLKVRHTSGVASTAVYIVSGYAEAGQHEVLGLWMAPTGFSDGHGETSRFWQTVFVELQKRGLQQALIVASDLLNGLPEALSVVYPHAQHVPCVVHLMRASLRQVASSEQKAIAAELKQIYQAPSYEAAEAALEAVATTHQTRYGGVIALWRQRLPQLAILWTFSPSLRKLVYTTNPQENINRQVRKVTKNRGALPNTDSAKRLLTLVLRRIHERSIARTTRPDWPRIVGELHLLFPGVLPENWGRR
jgi:transposase-like protein